MLMAVVRGQTIEMNTLQWESLAHWVRAIPYKWDLVRIEDSPKAVGAVKLTLEDRDQMVSVATVYVDGSVG